MKYTRFAALPALSAILFMCMTASALKVVHEKVILEQLSDYDLCQAHDYSGDWCHDAMVRWVKDHPADAFKAGKMTRVKMNSQVALPFFVQAFSAKKGDCKDEDVQLSVVAALNLPPDEKKMVSDAKNLALNVCFNEMKQKLEDEAGPDTFLFKNICKDLMKKGMLSGLRAKKCQQLS